MAATKKTSKKATKAAVKKTADTPIEEGGSPADAVTPPPAAGKSGKGSGKEKRPPGETPGSSSDRRGRSFFYPVTPETLAVNRPGGLVVLVDLNKMKADQRKDLLICLRKFEEFARVFGAGMSDDSDDR